MFKKFVLACLIVLSIGLNGETKDIDMEKLWYEASRLEDSLNNYINILNKVSANKKNHLLCQTVYLSEINRLMGYTEMFVTGIGMITDTQYITTGKVSERSYVINYYERVCKRARSVGSIFELTHNSDKWGDMEAFFSSGEGRRLDRTMARSLMFMQHVIDVFEREIGKEEGVVFDRKLVKSVLRR